MFTILGHNCIFMIIFIVKFADVNFSVRKKSIKVLGLSQQTIFHVLTRLEKYLIEVKLVS